MLRKMTVVISRPSEDEVRREVEALQIAARKIIRSKDAARKYLRENGFIRKDGTLTKRYGG